MTLLDSELANLSTVELGRIAAMQKENQTHGAPYGPIATATLDVLHARALLDAKGDARAAAQFADLSTADLNELASAGATLPTTWLAGRRARLLMATLHGRALSEDQHRRNTETGCYRSAPIRQLGRVCPPHRTTDREYRDWVANVVETLPSDGVLVTAAEKRSAQIYRDELAIWDAYLATTSR